MDVEGRLVDAIVRVDRGRHQPDIRDAMIEALFVLRRERWAERPLRRPVRHNPT